MFSDAACTAELNTTEVQHLNMHTKPLPRQRKPHVQKKGIEHIGIVKIVDYILQIKMA